MRYLAGVVVAALLALGLLSEMRHREALAKVHEQADALKGTANVQRAHAEQWRIAYEDAAQDAVVLARRAAKRDTVIRERIRLVRATDSALPDTCRPSITSRDSLIDVLVADTGAATWQAAFERQQEATRRLLRANTALAAANDSLEKAVTLLRHPPRRPIFAVLFKPEIRPAVFTGICANGSCTGIGVAATWRF